MKFESNVDDIINITNSMCNLMLHDITNPPLAARFFAYTYLAGYEVISENNPAAKSMYNIFNQYPKIDKPDSIKNFDYKLASLFAMLEVAGKMQPSGKLLDSNKYNLRQVCLSKGIPAEVIDASNRYGAYVGNEILKYARADGYRNISDYPRYTPKQDEGCWYPTPPAFFSAVEPYFNKIRPFILDSISRFKPLLPTAFNKNKGTAFYNLMNDVYKTGNTLTGEQRRIASFWDCNPFAVQEDGHLQIGIKKISPGAHWLLITGNACKRENISYEKSVFIHTVVAATLMDAFICCWDEKYRSNRIRPETAIRKYIDHGWTPLLQTPPFPEYLSGHSVISAASAEILKNFFGNNFSFTDSSELRFGIPPRHFQSFNQAALEAGVSRFYGGIHFMDAVDEGLGQGGKVGGFVIEKIKDNAALTIR
ncbi:vanadium-dependent haloperoxidase [Segetibacter koreensis]|uniref:vanadium-dependent haloperoxidase n=1 Tax=Segetibacter koreensis TaxID=398037 RepID=UPI001FDED1E2|nr:vanadium-dependent haloperoxidase [Segetibacter koreensis]